MKLKVWIIGIKGSVAATTVVGIRALQKKIFSPTGLLTETELFKPDTLLVPFKEIEIGGHDIKPISFYESAWQCTVEGGIYNQNLLKDLKPLLDQVVTKSVPPVHCGTGVESIYVGPEKKSYVTQLRKLEREVTKDILDFKGNDRCVVVNLASTEPKIPLVSAHQDLERFEEAIDQNSPYITSSMLNAYCAVKNGIPFVNFTPSTGTDIPALYELALRTKTPHYGKDGKTGETLVKSCLAPMFLYRNLKVLGWYGTNILGNLDGKVLSDPSNKASKLATKDGVLSQCLGYSPISKVSIDYFPPAGEDKIAWDFIIFEGFASHKMRMQFVWEGCDSILAAPLIIDLIRLMDLAARSGSYGLQKQLAIFFKAPMSCGISNIFEQYQMLKEWVEAVKKQEKERLDNKKAELHAPPDKKVVIQEIKSRD